MSYGKDVDPPAAVIENTALAVADLRRQVEVLEVSGAEIGEWHSAKINSVRFKVPWGGTVAVLEREAGREVVVYEFDEKAVE